MLKGAWSKSVCEKARSVCEKACSVCEIARPVCQISCRVCRVPAPRRRRYVRSLDRLHTAVVGGPERINDRGIKGIFGEYKACLAMVRLHAGGIVAPLVILIKF